MSRKTIKASEDAKDFNAKFKIGQKVKYAGKYYATWNPAGIIIGDVAGLFLVSKEIETPVPLTELDIDGYKLVHGKFQKANRRAASQEKEG